MECKINALRWKLESNDEENINFYILSNDVRQKRMLNTIYRKYIYTILYVKDKDDDRRRIEARSTEDYK